MPNEKLRKFFEKCDAQGLKLTFDDVRLVPQSSDIMPNDARMSSRFTKHISLGIPIVSSPMDTVTTGDMAMVLAEMGALGIIHRGLSPEMQAKEVGRVKHRLHGRIATPITVRADERVSDVLETCERKKYQFHTFPVVDSDGRMLGLVTGNDFDFCSDATMSMGDIMTPLEDLTTGPHNIKREDAYRLMQEEKKKVLPLVDETMRLAALYVYSDLKRILSRNKTTHNVDSEGKLVVGAAVGVGDEALTRAALLAKRGCDVFQIDTAHADSYSVNDTVRRLKENYPHVDIAVGNVSNGEAAKRLVAAGADGILVGQGPGSICTSRVVAGIGVPQVSAVYDCAHAIEGSGVPICADGGINNSGDAVLALAVGASSVMMGRLLAGTDEAPGGIEVINDKPMKVYRGMGSLGAMRDNASSRERYGQGSDPKKSVPEGVESMVPYRGSVRTLLELFVGGMRSGMGYNGAKTIPVLQERAELFRMSSAGLRESHPHDVNMHVPAPNYNSGI